MSHILICKPDIKYKSWKLHENYVLFLKGSQFQKLDKDLRSKILCLWQNFAPMKTFFKHKRRPFHFKRYLIQQIVKEEILLKRTGVSHK